MARPVDIKKKIEEIRNSLQKYNGIPSQTIDKAAYQNIRYYIKTYRNLPEIKALIEEYHLDEKKKRQMTVSPSGQILFEQRLSEIITILEKYEAFPKNDMKDYQKVYSFFKSFSYKPEVLRLILLYPYPESYNLIPNTTINTIVYTKKVYLADEKSAFKYVSYVFQQYKELPKRNTQPMMMVYGAIRKWDYKVGAYKNRELISFLKDMVSLGCTDEEILKGYTMSQFLHDDVQERLHQLIIENGACSLKYLSDVLIPNAHIPEMFIFNYYRYKASNPSSYSLPFLTDFRKPHSNDFGNIILYVHYNDYKNCNVESIRKNVIGRYRDWNQNPPMTIEDWRIYGQCHFFHAYVSHKSCDDKMIDCIKESLSIPEYSFENTTAYFVYPDWVDQNYDYILFLIENGYKIKPSNYMSYIKKTFDYNWRSESIKQKIDKIKKFLGWTQED